MKVGFYNTFSIGDFFFSQPFIKHICENNQTREFIIHTSMGSSIFNTIPNLSQIDREDNPHHHPIRYALDSFFTQHKNELILINQDIIFINTWVGILNKITEPENCECRPVLIYSAFCKLIERINKEFHAEISFPPMERRQMIYRMPQTNITAFLQFKQNAQKETLFYCNRMGHSANTKPFQSEQDHLFILDRLAKLYPEKYIIVPNNKLFINHPNIVSTSMFGVTEDHTCKNVFEDIEIAGNCTYAIVFDIGSCLTYCNSNFPSYTARFLHFSHNDRYTNLLKTNLEECLGANTSSIEYVHSKTPSELLDQIQKRIK